MNTTAEMLDSILPNGWGHDADVYGLDFTLTCPCGRRIEQDGECPKHGNPIREAGLI